MVFAFAGLKQNLSSAATARCPQASCESVGAQFGHRPFISNSTENCAVGPLSPGDHRLCHRTMPWTHLGEQVGGTLPVPPFWRIRRQVLQYVFQNPTAPRWVGKVADLPLDIRMGENKFSECRSSHAAFKESFFQNLWSCHVRPRSDYEKSLAALRDKPSSIEDERINRVAEIVQCEERILEITAAVR